VKTLPEPKSEAGFRAELETTMLIEGLRIPVRLQAHMPALPSRPLQKGTFIAASGVLRHIEWKAAQTPEVRLDMHMHDSTFPDRWPEVEDSGTDAKTPKD
jgi:hypothetical protein